MNKTIMGIAAATFACYIWGFLYWGVSNVTASVWKNTGNDEQVQQILRQAFPESGTYYIPGVENGPEDLERLFMEGPVAFVHIDLDGSSQFDPAIMAAGFLLTIAIVSLMATVFRVAGADEFRDFARLSVVIALLIVVTVDIGDMLWWQIPIAWKLAQAFYNFSLIVLAGHVLGALMKGGKKDPAVSSE